MEATLTDGSKVKFWFEYRFFKGGTWGNCVDRTEVEPSSPGRQRVTDCKLARLKFPLEIGTGDESPTVISTGRSWQHDGDPDCKETGRKLALARAVANLPKADRRLVWKAYLTRNVWQTSRLADLDGKGQGHITAYLVGTGIGLGIAWLVA